MLALLVGSLALNLIFIGLVSTAMWRYRTPPHWAGAVTPNLLGYASTLPAERRKDLWNRTAEQRQLIRPFRRELRAAREEVMAALATEPFDRERFAAAQERLLAADQRARAAVQALYAEIAVGLTSAERQAFPSWREHRRPPRQNLLDEPDQQVKEPTQQTK
jgi:uncharacterized membrane protein